MPGRRVCPFTEFVISWERRVTESRWVSACWISFSTVPEIFLQRQVASCVWKAWRDKIQLLCRIPRMYSKELTPWVEMNKCSRGSRLRRNSRDRGSKHHWRVRPAPVTLARPLLTPRRVSISGLKRQPYFKTTLGLSSDYPLWINCPTTNI